MGELYEAFAPSLFSKILLPRLGDRDAAEDALAETFRTALERLDRFEYRGLSIWYWLSRIAVNKATDMHRVRSRTSRALSNFESLVAPIWQKPEAPDEPSERKEHAQKIKDAIEQVLERINERYRRAIELRFFEEKSRQECADMMKVKLGTFDVLVLRALRAFRRQWESTINAEPEEI